MTEELRSAIIWTLVFLALELPAHWQLVPWFTLSSTVWHGEQWWHPLYLAVVVFAGVLLLHLLLRLSASYLVFVAVAIAVATVLHWRLAGGITR